MPTDRHHKPNYSAKFYEFSRSITFTSAATTVPILMQYFNPKSVVDVGCGDGTWLAAFKEAGVSNLLGIDGSHVGMDLLRIPADCFRSMDLENPERLIDQFDMVLSLEVAEHLSSDAATRFVSFLASLGKVICFSAAVPGQGGVHHLNEQWQSYWISAFKEMGFEKVDCIRPRIWNSDQVAWYYKQNIFIFIHRSSDADRGKLKQWLAPDVQWPECVIHPSGFEKHLVVHRNRLLQLEITYRILLATPADATLITYGFPNTLPFQRLRQSRVIDLAIEPLGASSAASISSLLKTIRSLAKDANQPSYLAILFEPGAKEQTTKSLIDAVCSIYPVRDQSDDILLVEVSNDKTLSQSSLIDFQ